MQAKHTYEKWEAYNLHNGRILKEWHIQNEQGESICKVSAGLPGDQQMSYALLFAAAPDLLAACEWALDLLNQYAPEIGPQSHIPGTQATKDQLRAAIRKAEGGAA